MRLLPYRVLSFLLKHSHAVLSLPCLTGEGFGTNVGCSLQSGQTLGSLTAPCCGTRGLVGTVRQDQLLRVPRSVLASVPKVFLVPLCWAIGGCPAVQASFSGLPSVYLLPCSAVGWVPSAPAAVGKVMAYSAPRATSLVSRRDG